MGPVEVDERLAAAWMEWWTMEPVEEEPGPVAALADLRTLQAHLATHGYQIVRSPGRGTTDEGGEDG